MHWENFYLNNPSPWGVKPTHLVRDQISNLKSGTVLDIGGGDGKNTIYLSKNGFAVTLVDQDLEAHKLCNEREQATGVKINHICENAITWKTEKSWDNVLLLWVLHYLPHETALDLISNLQTMTPTGGVHLMASFTNEGGLEKEVPGNFYPEAGVISDIYKEWEVLDYRLRWGRTIRGNLQEREYMAFKKN